MVKVYEHGEFEADFPEETVQEIDIVESAGRNVAEAISKMIQRAGYECGPPSFGDFAWEAVARFKRRPIVFGIHGVEPGEFHLFVKDLSVFDRWLPSAKQIFVEYLRMLGRELGADTRFRHVRWYSDKDRRHEHPVAFPVEDD